MPRTPRPTRTPISVDAAVPRPRQAQHAAQSAWTPTRVAHVGLLMCRAKPNTDLSQRGRRLGLHMSGCCCAAPNPTRTPVSVDADWGCTSRAVAVPRQTQHSPRSAWTSTGVAHVGLLMCRAKPNTHRNQRGRRRGLHMSGCCRAAPSPTRTPISVDADRGCTCLGCCCAAAAPHHPHHSISPQHHRPCTRAAHHWATHKPWGLL